MEIKKLQKLQKVANEYFCEKCDYRCSNLFNFTKHCSTRKHKMEIMEINGNKKVATLQTSSYNCAICGKNYATNAGLWKHNKVCKNSSPVNESTNITVLHDDIPGNEPIKNYIMKLVEQNNELKNMFIQQNTELHEKIDILSQHPAQITNIQNNNKTVNNFNLMVFLQERCKDALNMSQFIDTLQINTQSVEYTGAHGYVNGITKIFMDGLNQLDIHERPIHCTDLKRETLYIKENDKWEKDTEEKTKFKHALATVVNRNVAQVSHWEKENPRSQIPETDEYEFYFDIVRQSLGGGNHDVTARNNDKILRAIAGKVYLDKKAKEIQ